MSNETFQTTKERLAALTGKAIADVKFTKDEAAGLVREVKDNMRKSAKAGQTMVAGVAVASIGGTAMCFALVYLLNWLFPPLALWMCFAIVAIPVFGIGVAIMRQARKKLNPFEPVQRKGLQMQHDVHDAFQQVKQSVEIARNSAHESTEALKRSLSIEHQARKHPWAMMAGATALGLAGGILLRETTAPSTDAGPRQSSETPADSERGGRKLNRLAGKFEAEIDTLETLVIGALFGMARDVIMQAVSPTLERQPDDAANRMGPNFSENSPQGNVLNGSHNPAHQ